MEINIEHLSYRYKQEQEPILDDINLHISEGEWVLVSGLSGSGKTTLAYAIAGILFHQNMGIYQGRVQIAERLVEETPLYLISDAVGFVQQNAEDQFVALTVADEMAFGLENKCIHPDEIKDRIHKTLELTRAETLLSRQLFELSGGEKQKIAIASILAQEPSILILDEPTSNLDMESTRAIFEVLENLRREINLTVIVIEHKVALFADLFKRCLYLEDGKIQFDGSTERSPFFQEKIRIKKKVQLFTEEQNKPYLTLCGWVYENEHHFKLEIPKLDIQKGEIIALMGANGSGKSTFFKTLTGIAEPCQGHLILDDREVKKLDSPELGMIFQNADEQIFMNSVQEEIDYAIDNLHLRNEDLTTRANELLDYFGMTNKKNCNPHQLSYGEKKRVNLAAILVYSPNILLLDEVFIGQDIVQVNYIVEKIHDLREKGVTVIAAIHDPALMQALADRVIFLEDGKLRFCLTLQQAVSWWQVNGYGDYLPGNQGGL